MYKISEFRQINLKKNFFFNSANNSTCSQLEHDIYDFINLIRQNPIKLMKYLKNAEIINNIDENELNELINFIQNLSMNDKSFPPLIKSEEISKLSNDLLNYIINIKKTEGEIKYNLLNNPNINLRKRANPYLIIRGKYYEGIVLENNSLLQIICYILKDIKGQNVLFNHNIKYIGIACGFIGKNENIYTNKRTNKICTIIDLVQDFEVINLDNNNNDSYLKKIKYENKTSSIYTKLNPSLFNNGRKTKNIRNKYIQQKSNSYDKIIKRKTRQKKYNNNFIKENTYDKILLDITNRTPLLQNKDEFKYDYNITEKSKTPNILSLDSKIKSQKLFFNIKTPNYIDLNKIYNNNSFYYSKYEKNKQERNKTEEKPKKELDNTSEDNSKSSVSFSKQRSKKKLKPEEKLELLKQINKESREKSKKKKSAIKIIDDDSKSASFTNKKNNNVSNDASFSELVSFDDEKKSKININKLKNELKNEVKNEVKELIKTELENKININNELKIPLLKLFLNQNSNENSNELNSINNNNINSNRETKGIENYNYTNRSINSIDIFLPPNKNITAIDTDSIPGLININSKEITANRYTANNNYNNNKKGNVIIKKFVRLDGIMNKKRGNKTPDNTGERYNNKNINFNKMNSPNIRKKNFVYHKIPFGNSNIYCNKITKKNKAFNLKANNLEEKKINLTNLNQKNKNINILNSPRPINKYSNFTFQKNIDNNINNNMPKLKKENLNKIIKIPKKIINNLNYIDNNNIIINNKTNNIVYIKQTSPNRIKRYDINNIYKKK